jgi:hypothetical protein
VEPDQLPPRSRRLLKLTPHLESLHSKRLKVTKCVTDTSTYETCDYTSMSTESSSNDNESPTTHIPTVFNGVPSTPSTAKVVVLEAPIITPI